MIATSLVILLALVAGIWVLVEFRRLKHKIWAFVLIGLIVFAYLSITLVLREQDINYKSPSGVFQASSVYFSWLGSLLGNFRTMTAHAINLDWRAPDDVVQDIEEK